MRWDCPLGDVYIQRHLSVGINTYYLVKTSDCRYKHILPWTVCYGMAPVSRIDEIIGLFCRISSLL